MNLFAPGGFLQYLNWFLILLEFILGLYIILLNPWHSANRHVGALLFLFAVNNFALGLFSIATNAAQAALASILLAATSIAMQPALLLVAIVLLKPEWLRGRGRWLQWILYILIILPAALTLVDVSLDTMLWYTGLDPNTYTGGYVERAAYTDGSVSLPIRIVNIYLMGLAPLIPILYVLLWDKGASRLTRRLAWILLITQGVTLIVQFGLRSALGPEMSSFVVGAVQAGGYAFAGFQQMISERRLQRGRLQTRLTALILAIVVPILIAMVVFAGARARMLVEQFAVQEQEAEMLTALNQFQQLSWVMLVFGVVVLLVLTWLTIRQAFRPIDTLTDTATAIAAGDLTRTAPVDSEDEFGTLARTFNTMTGQLRELVGSLEQQVADRTADLERRAEQLQVATEVGYAAASILEAEELFSQAVELIRGRFGLYFVGLFLIDETDDDPDEQWAVLQAGTGEAGQAMLRRGHRRRVGEGMIGWSIANAQARVAMDVSADAAYAVTAELPDTRSEAALPLRSRGRVLGALTVQSDQPGTFDRDTIAVLQTMADQVAVALDNAVLFAESQKALDASRRAYGEISRGAWSGLLSTRDEWGYRYTRQAVAPVEGSWRPRMVQAAQDGRIRHDDGDKAPAVAVPLKVRDQVVGVLDFRKGEAEGAWTEAEVDLLEALADQLGAALDGARLFQDSQRRAVHEQLVGQITRRVRETLDVDTVLKTVADEMYSALGLNEVVVRLATEVPTKLIGIVASVPLLPGKQLCSGRDAANAIRLALEEVNYRVGDFTVRLSVWDNSGPDDDVWQPELEIANAERAVSDPDVLVYLGPTLSEGSKISLPILNRGGLAQIEAGTTYPGLTKPGYETGEPDIYYPTGERTFFRLPATDDLQGPAGALWTQELGLDRVYIVELDDAYGHELARTFAQAAENAGLTIVGTSVVASGQTTGFDQIMEDIVVQRPNLIYYTGFETVGIPLIRALRTARINTALLGGDGLYVSALVEDLMAYAEGIMTTFPGVSLTDLGEEGQDFIQRFHRRFGYEPSGWTTLSYDGACLALAAIERAGTAGRAAIVQALREIEFDGLLGRYSFDENGDSQLVLMSGVRVENGTWQSRGLLRAE